MLKAALIRVKKVAVVSAIAGSVLFSGAAIAAGNHAAAAPAPVIESTDGEVWCC